MNTFVVPALLWVSAIGTGLIGGLYFAFSTFIMTALDRTGAAHGILAMNSINVWILKSLFMPVFYGTTLTSLALAGIAIFNWRGQISAAMLAAALLYVFGMTVVTIVCNVPLNNALAAVDANSAAGAAEWARYMKDWTFWNHVRAVTSLAAAVLFTYALCAAR